MSLKNRSSEETLETTPPHAGDGEIHEEDTVEQADEREEVEDSPDDRFQDLSGEIADLKEQLLRKQADSENFRKRLLREKEDAIRYANANLLLDLVQIMDDFERALKSSGESKDFDSFYSWIEIIEKQLASLLERKYGLKRFDSEGEPFDPDKHEALSMQDSAEHNAMVVLEDFQRGYELHGRVLRHAKVKVANPLEESKEEPLLEQEGEKIKEC